MPDITNPPTNGQALPCRKPLTPSQRRLLERISGGLLVKEAAAEVGITEGTAKIYLFHVRERTGMRTTFQMVAEMARGTL